MRSPSIRSQTVSNIHRAALPALLPVVLAASAFSADFIFINEDGPGEGLNDSTSATPVGGNPATTLGGQRLAALERAGEIWGSFLVSSVPVRVAVDFQSLGGGTLAAAGPEDMEQNFPNAPLPNVWYPVALANSLAGHDLQPAWQDINVTVNSSASFYYGFDNITPFGQTNFIDVILHELGHGLGFISTANLTTGQFPSNRPDIFSTFIHDLSRQATWPALSAAQRVQSATSDPDLVWNGPFTTAGAPWWALGRGGFALTAELPGPATMEIQTMAADFGGTLPPEGLARPLAITYDGSIPPADPAGACQPVLNTSEVAGNVAFIRRGLCDFDDKVYRAQVAGAVAVIIADNVTGPLVIPSGDGIIEGVPRSIEIPVFFISKSDGDTIQAASPGVQIVFSPRPLEGTNAGRLRLYAPPAISSGSSVSHWSDDTSPNLLMEPYIHQNLDRKLDLTLTQMKDIGWKVIDIPFPHFTYDTWKSETFPTGAPLTGPDDDADGDGASNFEEYFFGGDPLRNDSLNLPVLGFPGGEPTMSFIRSRLPADLAYTLEKSTDLTGFAPAVEGVDYEMPPPEELGSNAERIYLRLLNPPERLFLRLRISQTTGDP